MKPEVGLGWFTLRVRTQHSPDLGGKRFRVERLLEPDCLSLLQELLGLTARKYSGVLKNVAGQVHAA